MKYFCKEHPHIEIPFQLSEKVNVGALYCGSGAVSKIGEISALRGKNILLVSDRNTLAAAGQTVYDLLSVYSDIENIVFNHDILCSSVELDFIEKKSSGKDLIVGVGSGTINDLCRLAAHNTQIPFYSIGTAPTMDGYLSANSSVVVNGVKSSFSDITPAQAVIIDNDIFRDVPVRLVQAGIGDSIAKIISLFDWHVDHLARGTQFNRDIFNYVYSSLHQLVDALIKGEFTTTVLTEFLLLSGAAMNALKNSQPASGGEHLAGHILEMIEIQKGEVPVSLHGEKIAAVFYVLYFEYLDFFKKFLAGIEVESSLQHRFPEVTSWKDHGLSVDEGISRKKQSIIRKFNFSDQKFLTELRNSYEKLADFSRFIEEIYVKYSLPRSHEDVGFTFDEFSFALRHGGCIRERVTGLDLLYHF